MKRNLNETYSQNKPPRKQSCLEIKTWQLIFKTFQSLKYRDPKSHKQIANPQNESIKAFGHAQTIYQKCPHEIALFKNHFY